VSAEDLDREATSVETHLKNVKAGKEKLKANAFVLVDFVCRARALTGISDATLRDNVLGALPANVDDTKAVIMKASTRDVYSWVHGGILRS
jgi:hypothetical protein